MAGANPFLMMEEEFSSGVAPGGGSNPFLMDDMSFPNVSSVPENPFLFESTVPVSNGTNPFAFMEPVVVQSGGNAGLDIFGDVDSGVKTVDFFTTETEVFEGNSLIFTETVQKPDNLELKHTNTVKKVEDVGQIYSSDEELMKMPPRRPPPPRPNVPPSKETQDLIMSVTGAMDATSSHLLDRIPPTRTPSPVSMRDLHSPSPTPEHAFADFLDVDGGGKNIAPVQPSPQEVNLLDVSDEPLESLIDTAPKVNDPFMSLMGDATECDINQNHQNQHNDIPPRPVQPPRPQPPRPQPPQKPPPPRPYQPEPLKESFSQPPQPVEPLQPKDDLLGMLEPTEVPKPAEPKPTTTADIMSLYSSPQQQPPPPPPKAEPIDLLCDNNGPLPSDTLISPSLSQHDIHMDTSDTQSKGSGSSATFNPFTSEETIIPAMLDTNSPIKTQELIPQNNFATEIIENDVFSQQNDTLQQNEAFGQQNDAFGQQNDAFGQQNDAFGQQNDAFGQHDDFDAFAAKFDSVASAKVGFDPFSGSAAWGDIENDNVDTTNGFDADESFDAFLSMQAPPAVPQGTPAMLSKRESQESDEDKDFSVFIK